METLKAIGMLAAAIGLVALVIALLLTAKARIDEATVFEPEPCILVPYEPLERPGVGF